MTREYLKSKIDIMPESEFNKFAAILTPIMEYFIVSSNEDPFYSETNQAWIANSIGQFSDGTPLITKTFEELKAYED